MAKVKTPKYIADGLQDGVWVRCWKVKREIVVQVWLSGKSEGEPEGDWEMPGVLGPSAAIAQSILQTRHDAEIAEQNAKAAKKLDKAAGRKK